MNAILYMLVEKNILFRQSQSVVFLAKSGFTATWNIPKLYLPENLLSFYEGFLS